MYNPREDEYDSLSLLLKGDENPATRGLEIVTPPFSPTHSLFASLPPLFLAKYRLPKRKVVFILLPPPTKKEYQ
jgi:hypothetical protein